MGSKDSNYQVIYRYEPLPKFVRVVGCFFSGQNPAAAGFWLGKTYDGVLCLNLIARFPWMRGLSSSSSHRE
ncbi:Uncharacterised protein [Klebsiella pneumoniae subsp. pneumoniae]|uniref:Uncharacterized protein n=1 Tax=Klebsiella pneumoniae subsp. pneumoniae TaxID=72407 RepID=A0A377YUQ0_KLEPN|nr:Uncharacterised protein [Klebsiella pneumoniae subsp. pneumoniae]